MTIKRERAFSLAAKNVCRKMPRTFALIFAAAMLAFVLFAGLVLTQNLENGLKKMTERFGADIMVVPEGYDGDMESILLGGEPKYFYFDKSIADRIASAKGVAAVTPQLYLVSSSRSCCASEVQFIGVDFESDFVIKPWISKTFSGTLRRGDLLVGSDVPVGNSGQIKFYGQNFTVAGILDRTGSGVDNSVYASMETVQDMYLAAKARGFKFKENLNVDRSISAVMVKSSGERSMEETTFFIKRALGKRKAQIIPAKNVVGKIEKQIGTFVVYVRLLQIFVLLFSVVSLAMLFSVAIRERTMEFATLRAVGASARYTRFVVIFEALFICALGAVAGIALASIVVFPFHLYIGGALGLPYVSMGLMRTLFCILFVFMLTLFSGVIASYKAALSSGKAEVYFTMART